MSGSYELDETTPEAKPETGGFCGGFGLVTDTREATRFIDAYGPHGADSIRFVEALCWHVWDGARWRADSAGFAVQEFAKENARARTAEATRVEPADARVAAIKVALAFEGRAHVSAVVDMARSDPRILIASDELDADPWSLNCENGILDLRTGQLRPHDRRELHSKIAPVAFAPDAQHPALTAVIGTIAETCGADVPPFLARVFGYCLTGCTSADALFLLQGAGGAGKTTLTEAVAAMLGDYATKLPFEAFTLSRGGKAAGGASPEKMKLRGARLALAEEGDRSATLDAGLVKEITGGGALTGRNLYQGLVTFQPTHKLFLVSNFEPHADSDDTGVWRRIIKIQFQEIPPERRDRRIREALLHDPAAKSALLAWAVRGCRDWQQGGGGRAGLGTPASIDALSADYRNRMDTVEQWLTEALASGSVESDPYGKATNKALREAYESWAADTGITPLGGQRFHAALAARGLRVTATNRGRVWQGISVRTGYYQ